MGCYSHNDWVKARQTLHEGDYPITTFNFSRENIGMVKKATAHS